MKIIAINSLYRPYRRGGAEVIFQSVVDELKKEHDVTVITIGPWSGFASLTLSITIEEGVKIYRYFPLNLFSFVDIAKKSAPIRMLWHVIDMLNIHTFFTIKNIIKKESPDVVLSHNVKGLGYTALTAIRRSGVRHVHTLHDIQLVIPSGLRLYGQNLNGKGNPFIWVYKTLNKLIIGSLQVVVSPSHFLKKFYTQHGFFKRSKFEVLPNPFEAPMTLTKKEKQSPNTSFFFLGQLEPHKGLSLLLDVFKKISNPDVRLYIAGSGSLEPQVRNATENDARINYMGALTREQIPEVFSLMDYMVLPTLCYENSPTVVLESLGYGVPVIVSDIGGAAEFVKNGMSGWIIPPADANALLSAMLDAIQVENYHEMSEAAHATVSQLSMREYIKKILAITGGGN